MKGAGEPYFEHDFPPGSDIIGDIQNGPKAAERMEFELFGRLARHMDLYPEEKQVGVDTDEEDEDEEDMSEEDEEDMSEDDGDVSDMG